MNALDDLLSSAMNQQAPETQPSSASLSGPEVFNQLMSKSSWKQLSCVCSVWDACESDRELMGSTNFLTASTARWHRPCSTARGSFKGGILYILGVDTDLGSGEGGQSSDLEMKSQFLHF